MNRHSILLLSILAITGPAFAADDAVPAVVRARCAQCHGPEKQRGGLRLDTAASAIKGGDSGPITAKDALLKRVQSSGEDKMPPNGERLTKQEIESLSTWLTSLSKGTANATDDLDHWSFKPVIRAANRKSPDEFIGAALRDKGLSLSPEADRRTLLRRVTFDLIGLPPTPAEFAAFLADESPTAYEKVVERLLASPHFGERQARHWLDAVRFAESHGFEMNQPRPNAYHYRDYVIRSFNADKPYDRFVREQLAGDSLGADAAMGFLVAGPWDQVKSPDAVLTAQQRADELHDIASTTGSAILGLTVGCARCHAHKFDPISQVDYYAMKAVFAGVQHGERSLREGEMKFAPADALATRPGVKPGSLLRPPVSTGVNVERFAPVEAAYLRFTVNATNNGNNPCIDELEVFTAEPKSRNAALDATVEVSGSMTGNPIHKPEHLIDGKYGNGRSWISNQPGRGQVTLAFKTIAKIDRVLWSRDRTEPPSYRDRVPSEYLVEVSADGKAWIPVAGSGDRGKGSGAMAYIGRLTPPEATFRLHRGDVVAPKERVEPGVLASFKMNAAIPPTATDAQRRLAFAEWATDPRHPLTARVIVNRLWQSHFGTGLVETPSDFGRNGATPSHPELLDWLAAELVAKNWSLKQIHRTIVLSKAYRQSSDSNASALARDAQSRLLWRYPPRRLEAEAVRDAVLATSGKLDRTPFGPGFDLFEPNANYVRVFVPKQSFGPETFRRMIYQTKPRMQLDDTFGAFDCPDAGQIAPKRSRSTTPLQALNLLNSPFVLQQAGFFAERLKSEAGDSAVSQVNLGFSLAFGREPTGEELEAAIALIRAHGLPAFARALFNANEFVFVR